MESQECRELETTRVEDQISYYLRVIRKHWKVVAGFFLAGCIITGIYSLLLPKEYEATASVLSPPDATGARALASSLGAQPGPGSALNSLSLATTNTKDTFMGILKSRTMQDDIIKRFDLVKLYEYETSKTPMKKSRLKLSKMTDIKASKEVISVTARAYDPKMAADIANFYVQNLDHLNTSINTTDAGRMRLFLENRVADARKALGEAEVRLKEFQSQSKAVVMGDQTKATIETAAKLEGQILAGEVQLKTLQTYSTQRNPDVIKLQESVAEMRNQLRRMEYGKGTDSSRRITRGRAVATDGKEIVTDGAAVGDFTVALGSVPSTGLELVRLVRETKIQETIFTVLSEQLEQAKVAEAKDTPTVKILDRAVAPEWKSGPKVTQNVAFAGFLSIFLGVFTVFFIEYLERVGKNPFTRR